MISIRPVSPDDAAMIADIYRFYAEQSIVTFGEFAIPEEAFRKQILSVTQTYPYFVAEEDGLVVGYAYGHEFREFSAYRKTVESTIFLRQGCTGRGIGKKLYKVLLESLKNAGYHIAVAVLAEPNPESELLHEKYGFEKIGRMKEVGYKFGYFIDASIWQKTL